MISYIQALVQAKLGQKGALFVEYALILAFVVVVGVVFLSGGLGDGVSKIFSGAASEVSTAGSNVTSALK